jgi:dipeptidyl-peptidase-4
VDNEQSTLYFSGRKSTELQKHMYRVNFDRYSQQADTAEDTVEGITVDNPGWHGVVFSRKNLLFLDRYCSFRQPPQVSLCRITTATAATATSSPAERMFWVEQNDVTQQSHPLHHLYPKLQTEPEFGSLPIKDEDTMRLNYCLFKPPDFDPSKKYPVLVYVYGGPHVQLCMEGCTWKDRHFFFQFLLSKNYLVFSLDNRGSANKGAAFEKCVYRNLSELEVQDQLTGVEHLRSLSFVDSSAISMYGHSYGGYMSLMCSFRFPANYLKAACSGAPVSDWALYDTHYTERYQGTPADNAAGYAMSSVLSYIDPSSPHYKGGLSNVYDGTNRGSKLLIYHGMADDNVLFVNSTKVYKLLQDGGTLFQTMDYPGSKHSMNGSKVKLHLYRTIFDFLERA